MTTMVAELRRAANLIFTAADQPVAGEISAVLVKGAAEIERLDADAAGAQAELVSVKACWAEALGNYTSMTTQRDHWLEIAREKDTEIERLRAALGKSRGQWIHSVNAQQCLEALGEAPPVEPGAVADEAQQRRNLLLRQQHAEKSGGGQ